LDILSLASLSLIREFAEIKTIKSNITLNASNMGYLDLYREELDNEETQYFIFDT